MKPFFVNSSFAPLRVQYADRTLLILQLFILLPRGIDHPIAQVRGFCWFPKSRTWRTHTSGSSMRAARQPSKSLSAFLTGKHQSSRFWYWDSTAAARYTLERVCHCGLTFNHDFDLCEQRTNE